MRLRAGTTIQPATGLIDQRTEDAELFRRLANGSGVVGTEAGLATFTRSVVANAGVL